MEYNKQFSNELRDITKSVIDSHKEKLKEQMNNTILEFLKEKEQVFLDLARKGKNKYRCNRKETDKFLTMLHDDSFSEHFLIQQCFEKLGFYITYDETYDIYVINW